MILLQVGFVEPDSRDVTFEACFDGLNSDQYKHCLPEPIKGSCGKRSWLEGPINPLTKANRVEYVATTLKCFLNFSQIE